MLFRSNDTMNFTSGKVRIRQIFRYANYKKYEANVKLTFGDVVEGDGSKGAAQEKSNKAPALPPQYKSDPKAKADPKKK